MVTALTPVNGTVAAEQSTASEDSSEDKKMPNETAAASAGSKEDTEKRTEQKEPVAEKAAETEKVTERVTEKVTETSQTTEKVTEAAPVTEKVTETSQATEKETEAAPMTEKVTEAEKTTEKVTESATEAGTERVTEKETPGSTEGKTESEVSGGTEEIPESPAGTEQETEEASGASTEKETERATEEESGKETESETESEDETEETKELSVKLKAEAVYAFVNEDSVALQAVISGGAAPYTLTLKANEKEAANETGLKKAGTKKLSWTPTEFGEYQLELTVTDAKENKAADSLKILAPVREEEKESDWTSSFANVKLTGDWRKDLVAIARTQIGYKESTRNFILNEKGEKQGYTRYGAWYGSAYEEWCAMFISFCLNYAKVPADQFPREAGCIKWREELARLQAYESDTASYIPQKGDLIFFGRDSQETPDHVGIVERVSKKEGKVSTIEGNSSKEVRRREYALTDAEIIGYGNTAKLMERSGILEQFSRLPEIPEGGIPGTTNASEINVRESAGTDGAVVAVISAAGTPVTVLAAEEVEGELWYKVQYESYTGYVREDFLEMEISETEGTEAENTKTDIAEGETPALQIPEGGIPGTTNASEINVRESAGTDGAVVAVISAAGTGVTVLAAEEIEGVTWYKIQYGDVTGYVRGDFLDVETEVMVVQTETSYEVQEQGLADALQPNMAAVQEKATKQVIERPTVEESLAVQAESEEGTEHYVSLPIAGKLILSAESSAAVEYQWQAYDGSNDQWANIIGDNGSSCTLTFAKIQNILSNSYARVRCRLTTADGEILVSATAVVSVDSNVTYTTAGETAAEFYENAAAENTYAANTSVFSLRSIDEEYANCSIEIKYVFADGTTAAPSWTAAIAAGSSFSQTVESPAVLGYTPRKASVELNYESLTEDEVITVYYDPAEVEYTVIHYQQNLNNDNYTEAARQTLTGYTDSPVGDSLANAYDGFYSLLYDTSTEIAADGSTVVEIYYDRYYYLMTFDLDGGYGVEPIYARYGSAVSIAEPTKAGYTFDRWDPGNPPIVMPSRNTEYTAIWEEADTTFTIVYWLENANDEGYSYWGSRTGITAASDSTVNGSEYKDYSSIAGELDEYEKRYSEYSHADDNVTIAGDGSTIVNVYYDRKEYTLKFYYAMSSGNTYYVVGGSTYMFGKSAAISDKSNEVALLDQYMSSYTSHRGQVDELPTLNSIGTGRNYQTGTDTSTITSGNWWNQEETTYTYYYISFAAKYGADISELWPCNVFNSVTRTDKDNTNGWKGTEAFVSAWNGEHNVYYSQHNENQTIKGNYNELDYQLLWDYGSYGDSNTVAYLCFWENGANINWSIPELYRYNIYLPILDGQDTLELTMKEKDGVSYYLWNTYDTVDDSDVANQTAPSMTGFTYKTYDSDNITDFDTNLYQEAYDVNFYYTRNNYRLDFSSAGELVKSKKIPYESSLAKQNFEPEYPSDWEPGAYVFEGWYTSSIYLESTKVDFDAVSMPASDVILYAHWVPATHTVNVYRTDEMTEKLCDAQTVTHGKLAVEPEEPKNGNYSFVGWFYKEGDIEKAFDFSIPVTRDLELYAKWSSNIQMEYKVQYALEDGTKIADDTTGFALAGTTKTFEAKVGEELYNFEINGGENYQSGYFPQTNSHSLTIDIENPAKNEYVFVYVQRPEVNYTVKYMELREDGTAVPMKSEGGADYPDKQSSTSDAVVTETFVAFTGYMPDAYQKRLVLSADESENVIIFYYTVDEVHAPLQVTHYIQNIEGDGYTEYQSRTDLTATIGTEYKEDPLTIVGFEHNSGAEGTLTAGTLTADGLHLKLYYDRIVYPYEFKFVDQATNKEIAVSEKGSARYQAQVTQAAKTILGYTLVSAQNQSITIMTEEGTDAVNNVKTFYYQEESVKFDYIVVGPAGCGTLSSYTETIRAITGTASGSEVTANTGFRFVGWYLDETCTVPVNSGDSQVGNLENDGRKLIPVQQKGIYVADTFYAKFEYDIADLTIVKSGMQAGENALFTVTGYDVDNNQKTWTVTLNASNPSVTIKGLKVSTSYTVTEQNGWSWRYEAEALTASGTIAPNETSVSFNNTRNNNSWFSDESSVVNEFSITTEGN